MQDYMKWIGKQINNYTFAVLLSYADRGGAWHAIKVLSLQHNITEIPMTKSEELLIINIM